MLVSEIFTKISERQIEGLMFHGEMTNYFNFLNLHGFKRMHEYHYYKEIISQKDIESYYINHHNALINVTNVPKPKVIPLTWYTVTRQKITSSIKQKSVLESFEKWCDWEMGSKELYSDMYNELIQNSEIASANKVLDLIKAVNDEVKFIERMKIKLNGIDYDMQYITLIQNKLHKRFKRKIKEDIHII